MKRPQPDLKDILIPEYINKLSFIRKFVRYWGVTTVDGVRVLRERKYYYPSYSMSDSTVKLAKHIGIYGELKDAKMKGVRNVWLYLNYQKSGDVDLDKAILANNLSIAVGQGKRLKILIGPKLGGTPYGQSLAIRSLTPPPIENPVTNQEGIIQEILDEYSYYWDNGFIVKSTENYDKYAEVLAKYILTSDHVPFTVKEVNKTYTKIDIPYKVRNWDDDKVVTAYATKLSIMYEVVVDIPSYSFTEGTDIVKSIYNDGQYAKDNYKTANDNLKFLVRTITRSYPAIYEDKEDKVYTEFAYSGDATLWYIPSDQPAFGNLQRYLREDALLGNYLTLDQKIDLINSVIDSDYRKKSSSFFEKIAGFAIIVVAVILAAPTGGASLAGAAAVLAVAATVTLAAFYITLAMALTASLGLNGTAQTLNQFMKTVEPLVIIASIITLYNVLQNLAVKGGQELAKESAKEANKTLTKKALEEMVFDVTMENVMAGVKSEFTSLFTSSFKDVGFDRVIKLANMVFDAYQKQDMASLQKDIKREEEKLAELEEAKENSKTRNLMMDLIKIQFNPLGKDHSHYSSIYDRPYERWATEYHTGNIQATTVNALWTKDA